VKISAWQSVQKHELQYHLRKQQEQHRKYKLQYWRQLLEQIDPHISITENSRILEVGCGCCPLLLAIEQGNLVGVDPLMDHYLEHFDYLHEAKPKWISAAAEELEFSEPFDIIFSINALDHTYDPNQTVRKLDAILAPGGYLVLSLNCHNTDLFYYYYKRLYRGIDSYHPHHFRAQDVLALFSEYEQLLVEDVDYLFINQQKEYRREVLQRKGVEFGKVFRYLLNPLRYPLAIARIFGDRPVHRKREEQKSIFSTYLFVFRKSI